MGEFLLIGLLLQMRSCTIRLSSRVLMVFVVLDLILGWMSHCQECFVSFLLVIFSFDLQEIDHFVISFYSLFGMDVICLTKIDLLWNLLYSSISHYCRDAQCLIFIEAGFCLTEICSLTMILGPYLSFCSSIRNCCWICSYACLFLRYLCLGVMKDCQPHISICFSK